MRFGDLEFAIVNDGTFWLDGGTMFGVVPKPLWERRMRPDDRNRIRMGMNSLVIRAGGKNILVETGAGEKWDAKQRFIYGFEEKNRLPEQLRACGIPPEKIDLVINTHLHFDHCGWNTRMVSGKAVPTFSTSRYVVQRGQFEHAKQPNERDRASYFPDNFAPMEQSGQWWLLDSDAEIAPGVSVVRVQGHTRDMQCVKLSGGGKTALFLADLVPTRAHLPPAWIMAYDLEPMATLEAKKKWIPEIVRNGWLALFGHDADVPAAYLRKKDGAVEAVPAAADS